jgi:hypothetical protein
MNTNKILKIQSGIMSVEFKTQKAEIRISMAN